LNKGRDLLAFPTYFQVTDVDVMVFAVLCFVTILFCALSVPYCIVSENFRQHSTTRHSLF